MINEFAQDPEQCSITGEGMHDWENLSQDDRARFSFAMAKSIMNVYNGLLLYKDGMLDRDTLDYFTGFIASARRCQGFAAYWATQPFPRELKEYVEDYERRQGDAIPAMDEYWGDWVRSWGRSAAAQVPLSP